MHSPVSHKEYLNFELLVSPKTSAGYSVKLIQSPAGEGDAVCRLDPATDLRDALQTLAVGNTDALFLTEFGGFLFTELFTGRISTLYRASLGIARGQGAHLRLRLRMEPPELAALPWEYLYDVQEDSFLAISAETALVRYVPVSVPSRPTLVQQPLRLLVVISHPRDLQPLNVEQEKTILQEALAEWIKHKKIELHVVEQATVEHINQAMRSFRPHIFHFVGHGLFDRGEAMLILEDENAYAQPISEQVFQAFFTGSDEVRLAVLNACQTATLSTAKPLVGLAPRLLQRKLSAVVAMQAPIPDKTALVFTREFYRSLLLRYPVDAAIAEARKSIFQEIGTEQPDWGIPVLFLRATDGQLFALEEREQAPAGALPPPEPTRLPQVSGFIGRHDELTTYADKLVQANLALIGGVAGVGKTALAAVLARQAGNPTKVFWHACQEGEGVGAIIWKVAGFLAWHGEPTVWDLLSQGLHNSANGGAAPPLTIFEDYLFQTLRRGHYLLCFDDAHHIRFDTQYARFIEQLRAAIHAGEIKVIITAQRALQLDLTVDFQPLMGLTLPDTYRLLSSRGLDVAAPLIEELHQKTAGNAQLLLLTIQALKTTQAQAELIHSLMQANQIEDYLLQEVDAGLQAEERAVMSATATLLGWPGTAAVIEELLDSIEIRRTLSFLCNQYLLHKIFRQGDPEYSQHLYLQAFYYGLLSLRQRRALHRRAGAYYETVEPDSFKAAMHYGHAGDHTQAARLATTDVNRQLYMGRGAMLLELLDEFAPHQLDPERWIQVLLAKGDIHAFLQQMQPAQTAYQTVLDDLAGIPNSVSVYMLQVRAYRGLGFLLKGTLPEKALAWLQAGLDTVDTIANEQMVDTVINELAADLEIQIGDVYLRMGNPTAAQRALARGLALAPAAPNRLRLLALINLSTYAYYYERQLHQSGQYMFQALRMADQLHDLFNSLSVRVNLAALKHMTGDWPAAADYYAQAMQLAAELGNRQEQAGVLCNVGVLHLQQGDYVQAHQKLTAALALARKAEVADLVIACLSYLAELHLVEKQIEAAQVALVEAELLATDRKIGYLLPFTCYMQCQYHLAVGAYHKAGEYAKRAVESAHQQAMGQEEGQGWRALGQTQLALHDPEAALLSFEHSLALLASNPYEIACTQTVWGQALLAQGASEQSLQRLAAAHRGFQALGAQHKLHIVDNLLHSISS